MLPHYKIDNYVDILLKMYGRTYSNTSCNVMSIATVENGN